MQYENKNLILSNNDIRQFNSFWNHNLNMKLKLLNSKKCLSNYEIDFANLKYKDFLTIFFVSNAINFFLTIDSNQNFSYKYVFDFIWKYAVYDNCFEKNNI